MPSPGFYIGDLMIKIITGRTGEISRVQYAPQKGRCGAASAEETNLPLSSCEAQGVPSGFAERMVRALRHQTESDMHRLMIARHGKVICDARFSPFDTDLWHVTYSMCKSVTGMAIGLLISEDRLTLESRLGDYFEVPRSGLNILRGSAPQTAEITVKDLLTMTSGATFNESGAVAGNVWSAKYMSSGVHFTPGTQFEYNSMNSYMLSALVTKITGQTMSDYLTPRLFAPLGITRIFWETSPEGYTKGGWGMFLRIEDMVKLGQLYLQHGVWEGQQIIPRSWADASVTRQVETGRSSAPWYGYHLWCTDTREGSYTFNGMLGQDVFIYPDLDMIVATQAGNNDIFQENAMAQTIKEMMRKADGISDSVLRPDVAAQGRLHVALQTISGRSRTPSLIPAGGWNCRGVSGSTGRSRKRVMRIPHPRRMRDTRTDLTRTSLFDGLAGMSYTPDNTSCGVMPLMMQLVHNNFTDGITEVSFIKEKNGALMITIKEGEALYRIPCDLKGASETVELDFHGEIYAVRNCARVYRDEENRPVLENRIFFPEEASVRIIRFISDAAQSYPYAPERLLMTMDETPGSEMMIQTLKYMTTDAPAPGRLISTIQATGVSSALGQRVRDAIRPQIHLNRNGEDVAWKPGL